MDGVPAQWQNFYSEVAAAVAANLRNPRCLLLDEYALGMFMRDRLPYFYDPAVPIVDLATAERRPRPPGAIGGGIGYAACGEAAAAVVASAKLRRRTMIRVCLQERPDIAQNYAHCVAIIDGKPQDVYSVAALPSAGCVFQWGF